MTDETSVRQLGNHPAVHWVPRPQVIAGLIQADPGLRHELAKALPDTVDNR